MVEPISDHPRQKPMRLIWSPNNRFHVVDGNGVDKEHEELDEEKGVLKGTKFRIQKANRQSCLGPSQDRNEE